MMTQLLQRGTRNAERGTEKAKTPVANAHGSPKLSFRSAFYRYLFIALALGGVGCNRQDGEKLARIARLSAEKVRDAAPAKTPFGDIAPDATPAGKVRTRLKTDAYLVEHPIQVIEEADGLHLRGHVPTKEHSDLAERLASQTVGVPKVFNELAVGP